MEYESPRVTPIGPGGNISYGTICSTPNVWFCVAAVYVALAIDIALAVNGVAVVNGAIAISVGITQYVVLYTC